MSAVLDRRDFLTGVGAVALIGSRSTLAAAAATSAAGVLAAQSQLAMRLVQHLAKDPLANTVISPASLAGALAVVDLGGEAALHQNLQTTLGFKKSANAKADLDAIRRTTAQSRPEQPFSSANAIVFDQGVALKPDALDRLKQAGVRASAEDFAKPETLTAINAWVNEQTKGKIAGVLDSLPPNAGMVALNALYFKDRWKQPFDASETKPAPFRLVGGQTVEVPLMRAGDRGLRLRRNDRFDAVDLPYATEGYSMVIVTTRNEPAAPKAFSGLGDWFTGAGFAAVPGEIALPRFDASANVDLISALGSIGFNAPATLPGFADGPLRVVKVQQRVELKVDEEGAEAAAATAAVATRGIEQKFVKLTVDRPFMFALRDATSGLIIVAGYIGSPVPAPVSAERDKPPQ